MFRLNAFSARYNRARSRRAGRDAGQRSRRGRRGADGGAAEDGVAVVEDGGLALGYAAGGVVQADADGVAVLPGRAGVDLAVGAELDQAVQGLARAEGRSPSRRGG